MAFFDEVNALPGPVLMLVSRQLRDGFAEFCRESGKTNHRVGFAAANLT